MKNLITSLLFVLAASSFAADHPRLLFSKDDIASIQERAKNPKLRPFANRVMESANAVFKAPPLHVSLTARGAADAPGEVKGLTAARDLQGRVISLCMAFTLSGEKKYRDEAVAQLDHALTDWKIWVDTAHAPPYDLMTGEVSATFGLAYDWLYNDLTPDERTRLRDGAIRRGMAAYLAGVEKKMSWLKAHHNWNTVCNGGATLLALALEDETPDAAKVLAAALPSMKIYWDHLGADGGWEEGTGYWTYGHRYALMAAEALRRCGNKFGDDVFAREGVKRTAYFPLVFNPGTKLSASFGDSHGRASDAIFYLLGREYKNPDFLWAQDRAAPRQGRAGGWPFDALALLWRPVDQNWLPEAQSNFAPKIDPVYAFPSIGWGFMAPSQPDPPYWLGFKNGTLAANHSHLDLNAVNLAVNDTELLVELGSRNYPADYFSAKRWSYYEISTAGNNSVLVGGKGQHPGRPGKFQGPLTGENFSEFIGQADKAYEVETPRARRNVVFVKKKYWVLLDDVQTAEPQPFELRFHTYGSIKESSGKWTFEQNGAALDIVPVALAEVKCIEEKPSGWIKPVNVLSVKSSAAATNFLAATVLYPRSEKEPACGPAKIVREGGEIRVSVNGDELIFKEAKEADDWRMVEVK
ncbi:MAG TPA: DUF4962 domain-containing protein [Planctomycetota bacterium]|nr:DUF4962 domain-containing protein [Planctomycetota bacterium]